MPYLLFKEALSQSFAELQSDLEMLSQLEDSLRKAKLNDISEKHQLGSTLDEIVW